MQMQFRQFLGIVTIVTLASCFLISCGDKPAEKAKPSIVSKKIAAPDKSKAAEPDNVKKNEPVPEQADIKPVDHEAAQTDQRIYDPSKRLDPFLPLYRSDQDSASVSQPTKSKRKKRTPQTPLERISLDQLQLRAIIRASSGNRALVEDSSGKGYIIRIGTYMGLNSGIVNQITPESVIVEEEIENLMGELVLQNTEMKLQKPAGE